MSEYRVEYLIRLAIEDHVAMHHVKCEWCDNVKADHRIAPGMYYCFPNNNDRVFTPRVALTTEYT